MISARSVIAEDVERIVRDLEAPARALAGTTVLITGAAGFLCSYLVEALAAINDAGLAPRCDVLALDNLRTGMPRRLAHLAGRTDIRFGEHDVSLPLPAGIRADWIIHGASVASPTFYRRYPLETIDVNVAGTRRMLDLAREGGARGMLYLSTSEIYGDPDSAFIPTREDYVGRVSCTGPRACYDESKRLAETLCATYWSLYGTPVRIVRPFNVYGPGQRLDDGRIIPDLVRAALGRLPLVLFSDGRDTRAFCYVSDAVRAMGHVLLTGPDGEAFNVGNDERELSIRELAEEVRQIAGPPLLPMEQRTSEDLHYHTDSPRRRCPDLTKLRTRFPWRPEVPLAEGLARTLRSYAESPEEAGCA